MDSRERFKKLLQQNIRLAESETFTSELLALSAEDTPSMLNRYRCCSERAFDQLENRELAFSQPAVFDDDEDSQAQFDNEWISSLSEEAAGSLYPALSKMTQMSREHLSLLISGELFNGEARNDLFDSVVTPSDMAPNRASTQMDDKERRERIAATFRNMTEMVDDTDARNALRRDTKVACLCENPDSERMWTNTHAMGRGSSWDTRKRTFSA